MITQQVLKEIANMNTYSLIDELQEHTDRALIAMWDADGLEMPTQYICEAVLGRELDDSSIDWSIISQWFSSLLSDSIRKEIDR